MAPIASSISSIPNAATTLASRATEASSIIRRAILSIRQMVVAVPATYQIPPNNPSPGTIVGIVLGVVLGICFILWVIYTVFNISNPAATEVEVIKTKPRRSRNSARSEVIEVSRSRARSSPRRATREVIVEEVRAPRGPPSDDIVEVIEEHSPVHSPVRRPRRSSGYRNVDHNDFNGGRRDRRSGR